MKFVFGPPAFVAGFLAADMLLDTLTQPNKAAHIPLHVQNGTCKPVSNKIPMTEEEFLARAGFGGGKFRVQTWQDAHKMLADRLDLCKKRCAEGGNAHLKQEKKEEFIKVQKMMNDFYALYNVWEKT